MEGLSVVWATRHVHFSLCASAERDARHQLPARFQPHTHFDTFTGELT